MCVGCVRASVAVGCTSVGGVLVHVSVAVGGTCM